MQASKPRKDEQKKIPAAEDLCEAVLAPHMQKYFRTRKEKKASLLQCHNY